MSRSLLVMLVLFMGIDASSAAEETPLHWSYQGQDGTDHWGMLSQAYMTCESGSHQSPIDITMPRHARTQERLAFHYRWAKVRALDNGHTIQVNVPPGSDLHLNGRTYRLGQFHFHDPSEHHVDGKTFPLEMHLVHQDANGHVAVIAVLVEAGVPNTSLAAIWTTLPTKAGDVAGEQTLHLEGLLPPSRHHFSYHGSLTTPPCTEGVQWIVLRDPITMSAEQIGRFVSVIGRNARPIHPLHGRRVREE